MVQSLSGTGSLRVGADFIAKFLKGAKVYLSNPTWGNHKNIFTDAGVEWEWYRYALHGDLDAVRAGVGGRVGQGGA